MSDESEQADEIMALTSIFEHDGFVCDISKKPYSGKVSINIPAGISPYNIICKDALVSFNYFSPIILDFTLPSDYPSISPPTFQLSCHWLSLKQLEILSNRLNELWIDCDNGAIIFTWISFLQEEALSYLDVKFPLELSEDSMMQILQHNVQRTKDLFHKGLHDCPICFCTKPGSECILLDVCSHVVCKECLAGFVEVHVTEGNVKALDCPAEKCHAQIHPSVIKSLTSKEQFERYERLLLERTLDSMSDVLYCPRLTCVKPVIVEKDDNLGICSACKLAFCVRCRCTYHGEQPCTYDLNINKIRSTRYLYLNGSEEEKKKLERIHGKKNLKWIIEEEYESIEWLHANSRQCPHCRARIEKNDGCNKMICAGCRTIFCWLCVKELSIKNPYDHYSDPQSPCYRKCMEGMTIE